jgi:putative heme-binding domain-containing protein
VPRFTHTFVIYEWGTASTQGAALGTLGALLPGALPAKYHGNLFGVEPLQSDVIRSEVSRDRSSLKTKDLDRPITTKDTWFRPVDIQVGPDGAIYVCDLYEQRIDHASHYQGRIDRERGRVWRLKGKGGQQPKPFDLTKASTKELIDRLQDPNRWFRQTALMVLSWKKPEDAVPALLARFKDAKDDSCVTFLWALYQLGGLKEDVALAMLDHPNPYVRLWTVRVLCDEKTVSSQIAEKLKDLGAKEKDAEVRSQLAASIRRLPASESLAVMRPMLTRDEDAADIHIPLLLWWAAESKADADREALLKTFADPSLWKHALVRDHLMERLMRRWASAGTRKDLLACASLLDAAPDAASSKLLLAGFEKAYEGRSLTGLPDELLAAIGKSGGGSLALRLRQGDEAALDESLKIVADEKAAKPERLKFVQVLAEIHPASAAPVLLGVVKTSKDADLQAASLGALLAYDDPQIGEAIVGLLGALSADVRPSALNLLASRKAWAKQLLGAIDAGQVEPKSVPADVVQRVLFQRDDQIAALVKKHFGDVKGATTAEMLALVETLKQKLAVGTGSPYNGRKLYLDNCGKCHVLFGEGGRIGPDLTSYKRDDLHTMLVNVVNPSAQIREGFENFVVVTSDGRAVTGFIADQDARVVVIRGADGQSVVIPRSEIDELAASPKSLMPEGALKNFNEQQVRDLFAYLRATQPLAAR